MGGAIETNRPDKKNAHYQVFIRGSPLISKGFSIKLFTAVPQKTIKNGDRLLNNIQKLARVIDY